MLSGVFTVPGDGCVDYPPIMRLLKAQDYHGWLVVEAEQDPAIAHPLTYARLGYNNLSRPRTTPGLSEEVTCHVCYHAGNSRMLRAHPVRYAGKCGLGICRF